MPSLFWIATLAMLLGFAGYMVDVNMRIRADLAAVRATCEARAPTT